MATAHPAKIRGKTPHEVLKLRHKHLQRGRCGSARNTAKETDIKKIGIQIPVPKAPARQSFDVRKTAPQEIRPGICRPSLVTEQIAQMGRPSRRGEPLQAKFGYQQDTSHWRPQGMKVQNDGPSQLFQTSQAKVTLGSRVRRLPRASNAKPASSQHTERDSELSGMLPGDIFRTLVCGSGRPDLSVCLQ